MNIDKLNDAIGQIDFDLVEAADKAGKKAKVTAFKPWMKWAAAAVAIVIFAVGMPIALNMMGVFKSDNIVAPGSDNSRSSSEDDNSGIVTPIESSGSDVGEPESDSTPDSEAEQTSNSGVKPANNVSPQQGAAPNGEENASSPETPAEPVDSDGGDGSSPAVLGADFSGGSFVKDDMPSVTYLINGEYETFSYEGSDYLAMGSHKDSDGDGGRIIIDRYSCEEGGIVSRNADSGELVSYGMIKLYGDTGRLSFLSEEEIIETARLAALNTDIPLGGLENASAAVRYSGNKYYVTFTVAEGQVEVCVDNTGVLLEFIVKKDASAGLSPERIAAAKEKMNVKLAELNDNDSNAIYVLNSLHYEKWGSVTYAVFNVSYYPDKDSDAHKEYDYYCVV